MLKNIALVALAAVIAALVTFLPPSPGVAADTPVSAPVQAAPDCALQGWPYYDPACMRRASGEVRHIRVIRIDRVETAR